MPDNALAAAERGARLTAQLLAFSRVQRLEVRPTYVAPLIEEMRPLLRNVLGPGIEKKFDLDPHLTPVLADPTQLEVAVLNLAINARDAMPDGGTLTISSRKRRITDDPELEPGTYIELSITDTGVGMTPDVLARAFEPFFTTKEVGKGTGPRPVDGLRDGAPVGRHRVKIESEPGVGTTVRLYFRRADRDAEVPASGGKTGDELRRGRGAATVLVIDDDEDVRHFIAASLEEYGHEVIEAADGVDGIEQFGAIQPDLVIIDYIMPGLSGAEVAAHIVATKPGQPILFVSGYNETDADPEGRAGRQYIGQAVPRRDARRCRPGRARRKPGLARHPFRAEAHHHLVGAVVAQRPAEQIALDRVAAEIAHPGEIVGGLDALGGDRHAEALGELDDRLDDRDILLVACRPRGRSCRRSSACGRPPCSDSRSTNSRCRNRRARCRRRARAAASARRASGRCRRGTRLRSLPARAGWPAAL